MLASTQPLRNLLHYNLKSTEVPGLLRDVPTLDFCLGEQRCSVEKQSELLSTNAINKQQRSLLFLAGMHPRVESVFGSRTGVARS